MEYMKAKLWRVYKSRISAIQSVNMGVRYCGGLKKNVFEDKGCKKQRKRKRKFMHTNVEVTKCDRFVGIGKV